MFRTHPELAARSPQVRKILLVTPEVKAYQVSAGDVVYRLGGPFRDLFRGSGPGYGREAIGNE
ncbi:hypothetical protein L4X63_12770 [Geomonas sp. Red32]|uniref:hypothetical protein n=1 Tax=Geomonas sp. Red32 TaxID=2912856 RepID=UPI00202D01A1|nr:hypothetical protein [Geomonas sp. Red32]MCM0082464.1 hypothetical protein [Geomonas sp. Red32]